jgi:hypothetical protein
MTQKPKLKGIADLYIVEDAKKAASANPVAPIDHVASVHSVAGTNNVPPTNFTAAPIFDAPPNNGPATHSGASTEKPRQPIHFVAAAKPVAPPIIAHPEQFLRIPNEIIDKILPTLKPTEQAVLLRLYRLSRGFQSDTCQVSIKKLASGCKMGTTQTRIATQELEKRGLIRRTSVDLSNTNQTDRGILFEILLPGAAYAKNVGAMKNEGAAQTVAGPKTVAIKENMINKNTQTQVSVCSRFRLEDCQQYANHLKLTGQGITNPGGYATKIFRSGEADALIEAFLNPPTQIDISKCQDCRGTGFIYVDQLNHDRGVKQCKHTGLTQQPG